MSAVMVRRRFLLIFTRFLIPYLICLLMPLVFGSVLHQRTLALLQQEEMDRSLANLRQTASILDKRLADVENLASHLARDRRIPVLKSEEAPLGPFRTMEVVDFVDGLYTFNIAGGFLLDYFIIMKRNGLAIGPKQVYRAQYFHRSVLNLNGLEPEDQESFLLDTAFDRVYLPSAAITYKERIRQALLYVESLRGPEAYRGVIVIMIDGRAVSQLLSSNAAADGGWVALTDGKGIMMAAAGVVDAPETIPHAAAAEGARISEVEGERAIITHTTLPFKGWRLTAFYPAATVLAKAGYVRTLTLAFFAAPLAMGLVIAVYVSYRRSSPLADVVGVLSTRLPDAVAAKGDVLTALRGAIAGLVADQRALERQLDAQRPLLQAAVVERLLKNDLPDGAELRSHFESLEIKLPALPVVVGLIDVLHDDGEELQLRKLVVKDLLRRALGPAAILHDPGLERIAVLTSAPGDVTVFSGIESALDGCRARGIKAFGGLGRPVSHYTDVAESFEEAKTALHAAAHQARSQPVRFDDLPGSADGFALPPDVVSRLAQLVTSGAETEGRALLSGLFRRNAAALQSSEHLERVLLSTLLGNLLAVRDRLALPPEPSADPVRAASEIVMGSDDPNDAMDAILAVFVALCESHRRTNSSANAVLMDGVRSFMEQEFPDKNLTLSALAESFKISEYHLSRSFKARFGITVYGFLEDVRIARAEELLAKTDDPVRQIAEAVGYGSSSSFCRSYRKRRGVSPTQFRRMRTIEQTGARSAGNSRF